MKSFLVNSKDNYKSLHSQNPHVSEMFRILGVRGCAVGKIEGCMSSRDLFVFLEVSQ